MSIWLVSRRGSPSIRLAPLDRSAVYFAFLSAVIHIRLCPPESGSSVYFFAYRTRGAYGLRVSAGQGAKAPAVIDMLHVVLITPDYNREGY